MVINPVRQIEAETSLLGGCLIDGVSPPASPDDFSLDVYRKVAATMQEMDRKGIPIDAVTVYERVMNQGVSATDLARMMETVPSAANADTYAKIVREFAACRRVQMAALNFLAAMNDSKTGARERVSEFCGEIMRLADTGQADREQTAKQAVMVFLPLLDRRVKDPGPTGMLTGISKLDTATCGLQPGDFLILAARPSMGKTALALNIAAFVAANAIKTLFFSLEMSTQQVLSRVVSSLSRVPLSGLRSGDLGRGPWYGRAHEAMAEISEWPLVFVDSGCSEIDIIRKARKHKPGIVLVDYLQLVRPSSHTGNANYDYGAVSKALKNLAKDQCIPVVLLCQLNRAAAKEKREPRLDDLRDSGEVEQDADMVLFVHSDDVDHTSEKRKLLLLKNRQGETGKWLMHFNRNIQLFEDMA